LKLPARGRAAGKVILLGEHVVVYARPALAAGLARGLEVRVERGAGPLVVRTDAPALGADERPATLVCAAAEALGVAHDGVRVEIRSELPAGAGLGSSAALSVAVLRALAAAAGRRLALAEELALGRRLEAIFHGNPSGIDPAAAVLGGCFRFTRGEPPMVTPLSLPRPLPLVVAYTGRGRSTGAVVAGLRARWESDRAAYERGFDEVAGLVAEGAAAVECGDVAGLGRTFDENQRLLEALGVSAPEVESLVATARNAGAFGAKLTGGGGGGAVIAVAAEPERVAAALRAAGAQTMVAVIGAAEEEAA
jgi:mevalonate kinase